MQITAGGRFPVWSLPTVTRPPCLPCLSFDHVAHGASILEQMNRNSFGLYGDTRHLQRCQLRSVQLGKNKCNSLPNFDPR